VGALTKDVKALDLSMRFRCATGLHASGREGLNLRPASQSPVLTMKSR